MVPTIDRSGRVFTYSDLNAIQDNGNRYELSFGTLVVTPAPDTRHQAIVIAVGSFLHERMPPFMRVLADAELLIRPDLLKRPDVQVVEASLVGGQSVVGTPSLVVEVHSPATRMLDLTEKRLVYAQAGIPAYWLIDPDAMTLTVLELSDDEYLVMAVLEPGMELAVNLPFTMTVIAAAILS